MFTSSGKDPSTIDIFLNYVKPLAQFESIEANVIKPLHTHTHPHSRTFSPEIGPLLATDHECKFIHIDR